VGDSPREEMKNLFLEKKRGQKSHIGSHEGEKIKRKRRLGLGRKAKGEILGGWGDETWAKRRDERAWG